MRTVSTGHGRLWAGLHQVQRNSQVQEELERLSQLLSTVLRRPCHSSARQDHCESCLVNRGFQLAVDVQSLRSMHAQPSFAVQQAVRRQYSAVPHPESPPADDNFERLWQSRRGTGGWPVHSQASTEVPAEQQKLLQVGIVGVPNAGKSTLINRLVGCKVSAVSPKTNTTTVPTLGAFTEGVSQVILHDTPGVVDSRHYRNRQHQQRVRSAWSTASACDLLLLIVDAHRQIEQRDPRVTRLVTEMAAGKQLGEHPPLSVLLLNKMDKLTARQAEKAPRLAEELNSIHSFEATHYLSAAKGQGLASLREDLLSRATLFEWIMDPAWKTDMSPAKLSLEIVREKVFERLRQELPYEIEVKAVGQRQLADGSLRFDQTVVVPTEMVRRMVIGRNGAVIGEIGIKARKELEQLFDNRVHLFLQVKAARQ